MEEKENEVGMRGGDVRARERQRYVNLEVCQTTSAAARAPVDSRTHLKRGWVLPFGLGNWGGFFSDRKRPRDIIQNNPKVVATWEMRVKMVVIRKCTTRVHTSASLQKREEKAQPEGSWSRAPTIS